MVPTLCSVQFWLLVSRGNALNRLTPVRARALRIVWFIQTDPSSTSAKWAVVNALRSSRGRAKIVLAVAVLRSCRRANSAAFAALSRRNGSLSESVYVVMPEYIVS